MSTLDNLQGNGPWADEAAVKPWRDAEDIVARGHHVLLYGPPGTGKTYLAQTHALGNREALAFTVTQDTQSPELRGHPLPGLGAIAGHAATTPPTGGEGWGAVVEALHEVARAAAWGWMDGPGTLAWRMGHRLILDEVDRASGEVVTLLHRLLDERATAQDMTLPTGERVPRHPAFQGVLTSNLGPASLPPAVRERVYTVEIPTPHPVAVEALPEGLRGIAWSWACDTRPAFRVGLREWRKAVTLVSEGFAPDRALGLTMGADRATAVSEALAVSGMDWQEVVR